MSKKVRVIIISIFLLTGVLAFLYINLYKFIILEVEISNLDCVSASQIKSELEVYKIQLFTSNKKDVEERLRSKYNCIKELKTFLKPPMVVKAQAEGRVAKLGIRKIELELDEATASSNSSQVEYRFRESTDSSVFFADEEGFIFKKGDLESDLPIIEVVKANLDLKQKLGDGLTLKISYILEKLKKMDVRMGSIKILGDQLFMDGEPVLKFTLKNDLDRQIASLQLILQKDKMNSDLDSKDAKSIEMIDLRFDKPVVKYSSKK